MSEMFAAERVRKYIESLGMSGGIDPTFVRELAAAADYHDEIAKAADDNAELCRYTRSDFDFWCQKRSKHQKWAEAIRQAANKQ